MGRDGSFQVIFSSTGHLVSTPRRLRYTLFVMYNRQMARPDMVCHCLSLFEMIRNLPAWSDMVQHFVSHVRYVPTWSDIVRCGLTIQHTMEPIHLLHRALFFAEKNPEYFEGNIYQLHGLYEPLTLANSCRMSKQPSPFMAP